MGGRVRLVIAIRHAALRSAGKAEYPVKIIIILYIRPRPDSTESREPQGKTTIKQRGCVLK